MGILDRFKKSDKKDDILNGEPFIITANWGEEPSQEIIAQADEELQEMGLPAIEATQPNFSIIQFQLLLKTIFSRRVAQQADLGDFTIKSLDVLDKDNDDSLRINDISISLSNFENLTQIVLDGIFNGTEYADADYEDKFNFAESFNEAYMDELNVGENDVANIPTEYEANSEQGNLIPIHLPAKANETYGGGPNEDASKDLNESDEGNSTPQTSTPNSTDDFSVGDSPQEDFSNSEQDSNESALATFDAQNDLEITDNQVEIENVEKKLTTEVLQTYPIVFPKFDTTPISVKEVGMPGYPEYMLNQDKLHFNQQIEQRHQVFVDQLKAKLAEIQQSSIIELNEATSQFIQNADKRDQIHENVVKEVNLQREVDLKNEKETLEREHNTAVTEENSRHQNELVRIDQVRDEKVKQLTDSIDSNMEELVSQKERTETEEQTKELIKQRADFINTTQAAQKVDIEKFVANEVARINEYGSDIFDKAKEVLSKNANTYDNNQINAIEALAAKQRAQSKKTEVERDTDKFKKTEEELSERKSEVAGLKEQVGSLQAQLATTKDGASAENMHNLLTAIALNKNGSENDHQLSQVMTAFLQSQKPHDTEKNSSSNIIIGSLVGFIIILVLGIGAFFVSSQNTKVEQAQSQIGQVSTLLKETRADNKALDGKLSEETNKREAAEKDASSAKDKQKSLEADNEKTEKQLKEYANKTNSSSDSSSNTASNN